MNEIRSNPVKFLEEHLILNTQRYAHHDETSLITVNITREDGLLRLKETEYDMLVVIIFCLQLCVILIVRSALMHLQL